MSESKSSERLAGKVALVTGGSRGIGSAIVRRFAEEGATVYFTYLSSKEQADKLAEEISSFGKVAAISCDVRKKEDVEKAVETLLESESRIDILVNNAGVIRDGLFLTMEDEDWSEVINTNLGSVFLFCKAIAQIMMMQRYGRIINVSSIVGDLGGFGQANYAASKGAINSLTKSLAVEFASKNVTVNAIAPGMVSTDMSLAVRSAFGDKIKEKIPMGTFAEPSDIAEAAVFLASDEARYMTGQILTVDGGISLLSRR